MTETFVRVVRLREELSPVPIYRGLDGEPIAAEWLAISEVRDHDDEPSDFCLYLLDREGAPSECLQFETLDIALDQAHDIVGVARVEWLTCSVVHSGRASNPVDLTALRAAARPSPSL